MNKEPAASGNLPHTNRKGFTLVEVIVAAVIVAILAAVGVPILSGFIADAKQNSVDTLAETAAAAASSYWKKTGTVPDTAQIDITYDHVKYSLTISDPNVTVFERTDNSVTKTIAFK